MMAQARLDLCCHLGSKPCVEWWTVARCFVVVYRPVMMEDSFLVAKDGPRIMLGIGEHVAMVVMIQRQMLMLAATHLLGLMRVRELVVVRAQRRSLLLHLVMWGPRWAV